MDLLLIVRGLAALAVVIWHVEGYQGTIPSIVNIPGRTAVWLFFGVSGYVIAYGFVHQRYTLTAASLRQFYINRFLRIYPLFVSLSILAWVTELALTGRSLISFENFAAQLFAFQLHHDYVLSGVFWTLGIEIQFYLLAPILVMPLLVSSRGKSIAIAFTLFVLFVYWNRYSAKTLGWSYDARNVISNLPHFLVGMIGCRLVMGLRPGPLLTFGAVAGVTLLLGYTNWLYQNAPERYWSLRGIVLVDLMILALVLVHARVRDSKTNSKLVYPIFAMLGVLSYGVYAWHGYILKYIPMLASPLAVVLGASVVAAYASYRIIELPALARKRRHTQAAVELERA